MVVVVILYALRGNKMAISEYKVEKRFIERLESIGYTYVQLGNYADVIANFKEQLARSMRRS